MRLKDRVTKYMVQRDVGLEECLEQFRDGYAQMGFGMHHSAG